MKVFFVGGGNLVKLLDFYRSEKMKIYLAGCHGRESIVKEFVNTCESFLQESFQLKEGGGAI